MMTMSELLPMLACAGVLLAMLVGLFNWAVAGSGSEAVEERRRLTNRFAPICFGIVAMLLVTMVALFGAR